MCSHTGPSPADTPLGGLRRCNGCCCRECPVQGCGVKHGPLAVRTASVDSADFGDGPQRSIPLGHHRYLGDDGLPLNKR